MALSVKVENFEGPFDLLLHLIKKNEMSIYDIRIKEVAEQYMQYIKSMKEMDLEIASEFIVIASTLIEIKSKELLPKVKVEDEEVMDEEDIKKQLVEKLIEYKKFKAVASVLREKEGIVGETYSKKAEIIEEKKTFNIAEVLEGISVLHLNNIYNDLIEAYLNKMNEKELPKQITALDTYKIEDKMETLTTYINSVKKGSFSEVTNKCANKSEIIVTFLALLELIKLRELKVVQGEIFGEIYMERIENDD
ncbi:condensin subunit ScpA [Clostridium collagenovorans DSM 3089]|uniref:Segregation and condensation protein A n=1 Tax=Clostridium collagenovorans DSM 3089 TaxID=1121306 RepID=A0A1M5T691_9CLOT|nr:segregation/condensation protein A [Clostridium collagenovorans]SHH46259.1 condensin subunit ScpA [Clostridium collagenovorans DSM 3089]